MLRRPYQTIAILFVLVNQAYSVAQVGKLTCNVADDTITFDLIKNDEDILEMYGYNEATLTTCTEPTTFVVADPPGYRIETAVLNPVANPQPCGLSIPDPLKPSTFRYLVVTQSLPDAFAPNDRRYELECDIDGTVTQNTIVEGNVTSDLVQLGEPELVGEDLKLRILSDTFDPFTEPVTMGTPMVLEIQLSQGAAGAKTAMEFKVLSCQAALVEDSPPDPVALVSDSCATYISIFPEDGAMDIYPFDIPALTPMNSYQVRSKQISAFQFKNTNAPRQLLKFTCTVQFCYSANCFDNTLATIPCPPPPPAVTRKRRDTNSGKETQAAIAVLDMNNPIVFQSSPDASSRDREIAAAEWERIGYLIGLIVLAGLLFLSMGLTLFLFTRHKQNVHAERRENANSKLAYTNPEMS